MGKKKFNVRQKNQVEYIVNNVETKKIQIDLENDGEYNKYDKSNALVLPSKKRDTKAKYAEKKVTRILSKKQRKKLEKIVDKKHKKANRSSLLESLASVQLPASDLKQLVSITAVQTKGLKKHFIEQEFGKEFKKRVQDSVDETNAGDNLSSIAGSRKRKRLMEMEADDDDSDDGTKKHKDYNVVGFDQSSDEEDDDNEEDEKDITNVVLSIKGNTKKRDESILESTDKTIIAEDIEMEPRKLEKDHPINVSLQKESCKPAVYVHVERDPKIQAARLKLPILGEEQIIMECINENSIVILAGETGSGKTTQVPQFLYEAGYAEERLIGVTEPRRVAAISMSKRVATEMNLSTNEVSYLIRFEGNTTDRTKIKFMTDGVLLKEIESDFMLTKYSVIILDEAHERSVYTDILIGLLSRIVPLRNKRKNPLKLIIMSATLRISDFTENNKLFKGTPPVLKVDARQYPVTIHFNKRTNSDYVKEAFNKAVKIHTKLPEGGILIFLTGQQEVHHLIKKLRKAFPFKDNQSKTFPSAIENENYVHDDDYSDTEFDLKKAIKKSKSARKKLAAQISLPNVDLDSYKLPGDDTEADLLSNINSDEENNDDDSDLNSENEDTDCIINTQPLWILPLYSLLSSEKQAKVFDPPPPGTRLCVVATNVAETSLTIPNIKYVIDCGRQKTRLYDKITGVSSFVVTFASKASANQRAGRAGRMGPGHCYRLYSSAVFNDEFEEFSIPEIQKKPVDDLMLQMKCMGIDRVINFPFPSPPNLVQLEMAEKRLKMLGALEDDLVDSNGKEIVSKITNLGKAISVFPVAPRFGKMLALSHQHDLLPYTICMVASLSVQEVLQEVNLSEDTEELAGKKSKWHLKRKAWAGHGHSLKLGDPMVLLRAVGASEYAGSMGKLAEFCQENGLRLKAVTEIRKLRVQLTNEINLHMPDLNLCVDPKMEPPTDLHAKYLRQILLAGMGDQVARKIPDDEIRDPQDKIKYKYAYNCPEMEEPIFMHSSSVLKKEQPEFVIYQEAYEIQNGDSRKMFMRGITAVEPTWLVTYVPRMCNFTRIADEKPVYKKEAGVIVCKNKVTFGKSGWELPDAEIEMPLSADACKYFGIFFLNGEVFPSLAKYQPKLLSTPSSMVKIYNKLIPRVEAFTKALIRHQINSREKLLEVWKTNQNYLLTEYKDWLPDNLVPEVSLKWPPLE